jgi:hypothetical protein
MTEDEYSKLCSECNSILNKAKAATAVAWLHIIKEHPEAIKGHEIIFNHNKININIAKIILLLKNLFGVIFILLRSIFTKPQLWYSNSVIKQTDVLLISHLISKKHIGAESDFYYGELGTILQNAGFSVTFAYIDHIGIANKDTLHQKNTENVIILLPSYINFLEELKIFKKIIKVISSLMRIRSETYLSKIILNHAIFHALSSSTFRAFRIKRQISDLLNFTNSKILLFTYEGHSWERLLAETCKDDSRNIISIGYQHNLISRLQNASLQSLGFPYDPDFIFASGRDGKSKLTEYSLRPKFGIEIIGSNRAPILNMRKGKNLTFENVILVIPEGLLSECHLLFKFSLKSAELNPNIKFIWRLHPALTYEDLVKFDPIYAKIPCNIVLSNNDIINDINLSSYVIYRGSTAVIQALSMGLRPIYLSVPGEISIDILYDFKVCKYVLTDPTELSAIFNHNFPEYINDVNLAIDHAKYLYEPQSPTVIVSSIRSLLLKT